jgi:hypothetical protein
MMNQQALLNAQVAVDMTPEEYVAFAAQQRDVVEAARQELLARDQARIKERKEAEDRARVLLLATLDAEQAKMFVAERSFVVHSQDRKRRYLVKYGVQGNVELLNDAGQSVAKFCIHPEESVPTPDVMLAQKLLLEADEQQFLKIANKTVLRNESAVA